jgi:ATP dependent DNA ligase-like protein
VTIEAGTSAGRGNGPDENLAGAGRGAQTRPLGPAKIASSWCSTDVRRVPGAAWNRPMREVAIFDERFVSRFEWLRQRPKDVATPPIYMAFDCLYVNGRDLRPQGLRERRQSLEKVIADQSLILPARRLALDGPSGVGGSPATKGWWPRTPAHPTWAGARSRGSR